MGGYKNKKALALYMRKYRKWKQKQVKLALKALEHGNVNRAKQILTRKPQIKIVKRKKRRRKR